MQCFEFTERVQMGISVSGGANPRIQSHVHGEAQRCVLSLEMWAFARTISCDGRLVLRDAMLTERDGYAKLGRHADGFDARALLLLQTATSDGGTLSWDARHTARVRRVAAMPYTVKLRGGGIAFEELLVLEPDARVEIHRTGTFDRACPTFFLLHWDGRALVTRHRGFHRAQREAVHAVAM